MHAERYTAGLQADTTVLQAELRFKFPPHLTFWACLNSVSTVILHYSLCAINSKLIITDINCLKTQPTECKKMELIALSTSW